MTKRSFILSYLLFLLIGIACNLTSLSQQLAEEDRIATSVAETIAAQTNVESEPTDIPTAQITSSSTPVTTLIPTPTQDPTLTPTTSSDTVTVIEDGSKTTQTEGEGKTILKIGDSGANSRLAVTLHDASLVESVDNVWSGPLSEIKRDGFKYLVADVGGQVLNGQYVFGFRPLFTVLAVDKDGDRYQCTKRSSRLGKISIELITPPGYELRTKYTCEIPVTVSDSLDVLQLIVSIPTSSGSDEIVFEPGEYSSNPVEVLVEKDKDKHIPLGEKFILNCGTKTDLEFIVKNPRWESEAPTYGGGSAFAVDLEITNKGKEQTHLPDTFALNVRAPSDEITWKPGDTVEQLPVPGASSIVTLYFSVDQQDEFPAIFMPYGQGNCTLNGQDYLIIEVTTARNAEEQGSLIESSEAVSETITSTTDTSTSSIDCSKEPDGEFRDLWMKYQDELGCPIQVQPLTYQSAEQLFENGHMFWVGEIDLVLITFGNEQGEWVLYSDDWDGSNYSCPVQVPAGKFQPVRGFGWIWCREQDIRERLGWALDEEQGFPAGIDLIQGFDNGILFRDSDGKTQGKAYVMFGKDQGTFVKE
jgi:hypothetical protein